MFNGWLNGLLVGLQTINNILTAGIAITAFSLFLYALSFNLRDRVARSFAIILLCVVVVFTTEALQNKTVPNWGIELLLRLQWVGIIFLPPSYLHLSDALLVTAGRPSRGRRRLAVRLVYVASIGFLILLALGMLVGALVPDGKPAPHLQRSPWTEFFTIYYIGIMVWAGYNFVRAFARMLTRSGQRRMLYLMAGATAPALGSYPYLLFYRSTIPALILEHGFNHKCAGCRSSHCHGLCSSVFWRFMARPRGEESFVQMAPAWTCDCLPCTGNDDDCSPGRAIL